MPAIKRVTLAGEEFFQLTDSDRMRPFFMSIVSNTNHWMFISSNGGLTAGRKNAEYALFPYYTDDKITESAETTGSKTIIRTRRADKLHVWEPFSIRDDGRYAVRRNLYKSVYGNKIVFEEINQDLELSFRYSWSSSNEFGFVRRSVLENLASASVSVAVLDGIQNVLPAGVGSELQKQSSNLVDAYKRSELHAASGLGIYALSAIIVDKAEPSEALKANVVWSLGLPQARHLLSSRQLSAFRQGESVTTETDVKGEKGAYMLQQDLTLGGQENAAWLLVANVNQQRSAVEQLIADLRAPQELRARLEADVARGTEQLVALAAAADGLQRTADERGDTRHFSNVLFNIMRGGIFDNNYNIERADLLTYLRNANRKVFTDHRDRLEELPEEFTIFELRDKLQEVEDPDLQRLAREYLPLKFSRRHGDPSRPWNKFSINTHSERDGAKILDYEGNWRDIFQNWEALAHSYPAFIEGMIFKFLNASTFDGYNPYRVTKGGFDWETIEEDDPWSYIGYWGDHQIIYLLKFLEFAEKHEPGTLEEYFTRPLFAYANVPYRIKAYAQLLQDPKDTVDFDHEADQRIRQRRQEMGADGALLTAPAGDIYRVNFIEKTLATLLAKISNFIPEGGIWMNTQRPEWNDANNALVGNGVSMVTLYYLRRFLRFFGGLLTDAAIREVNVSTELATYFRRIHTVLSEGKSLLDGRVNDRDRKRLLDGLGQAAAAYRSGIYANGFSGKQAPLRLEDLGEFTALVLAYCDHTIRANRREDGLYHAYNLMTVTEGGVAVSYLSEMLEGQVAVLSAGFLDATEALTVMDALKSSKLFREDQYSYLLYPNKELPGFLEKNNVPAAAVEKSALLTSMVADGDTRILQKDVNGGYHFNGDFKNVGDLHAALDALAETKYADQATRDRKHLAAVYEAVFNHKEFTGRSGTFYGYEGLGSIYWHMVSKLRYAVLECCQQAIEAEASAATVGRMLDHYYEIVAGIGAHKAPELYGAFPTDPYSHTPAGKGAQQPGMTGQVKEDLLSRFGELGIRVKDGRLSFAPTLLRKDEFLTREEMFPTVDLQGDRREVAVPSAALAFTCCQVPVIYRIGEQAQLEIIRAQGPPQAISGSQLDTATSTQVFRRSGEIREIRVSVEAQHLK